MLRLIKALLIKRGKRQGIATIRGTTYITI